MKIPFYFFNGVLILFMVPFFFCGVKNGKSKKYSFPDTGVSIIKPVNISEFFDAVGRKAMLLGRQNGKFDVWLSELRIIKDFRIEFFEEETGSPLSIDYENITVKPECTILAFSGEKFSGKMIFFIPVFYPGAVVTPDIDTDRNIKLRASFNPELMLMWPAQEILKGTKRIPDNEKFIFTESTQSLWSAAGSPNSTLEIFESGETVISFTVKPEKNNNRYIVLTGSEASREEAEKRYGYLTENVEKLYRENVKYYSGFLNNTVSLKTPDNMLNEAFLWSKIAVEKGFIENPGLGSGFIAGYGLTGNDSRPGFSWFFGRDALWTVFAVNAYNDFDKVKTALKLLKNNQRGDGKIMHELTQAASHVNWEKDYPYYYHCADANPLYILTVCDYVETSGDTEFLKEIWNSVVKAYEFSKSTDSDGNGFPENKNVGHGWVEGGPLYEEAHEEIYLAGLWTAALKAMSKMAYYSGNKRKSLGFFEEYKTALEKLNTDFFKEGTMSSPAFSRRQDGSLCLENTIMPAVPMWFGALEPDRINNTLENFRKNDISTDWGTRIVSNKSEKYDPETYHSGTVWPLFTGWVSTAEFRSNAEISGLTHLLQNAALVYDHSPGYVTEVLNGDKYQPTERSVQHQIWSSAMVLNPAILGLCGLHVDLPENRVQFNPRFPVWWDSVEIKNIKIGKDVLDITHTNDGNKIVITGDGKLRDRKFLDFSVKLPAGAIISSLKNDRITIQNYDIDTTSTGIIVKKTFSFHDPFRIEVEYSGGITAWVPFEKAREGESTSQLKLISTKLDGNTFKAEVEGLGGKEYELHVWTPWKIRGVEGGKIVREEGSLKVVRVEFGDFKKRYIKKSVSIIFSS